MYQVHFIKNTLTQIMRKIASKGLFLAIALGLATLAQAQ
jgi:hypothetical protein